MDQSETGVTSQIRQWASRQLADYDARRPGTLFADGVVLNEAEGYALQAAVAGLRCTRGERLVGYKVGCTSPKVRSQLGIAHSISGRLYDSEQHSSGVVLSRIRFANLAIEGELAVSLSREPNEQDFIHDRVPACVARVFPVIELHNHVMRGQRASAGELIANNAIHAGFVAGDGLSFEDLVHEEHLESAALTIYRDDRFLDGCKGNPLMKTINSSIQWLTKMVRDRGDRLSAGQIVLTGSIPKLISIDDDCSIKVDASMFGGVNVRFTS